MAIEPIEIIVGDFIREVSLEHLAQVAFDCSVKTIHYTETEKGKILAIYILKSESKILEDGTGVIRYIIVSVYYTDLILRKHETDECKKWLIYDHSQKKAKYTDDTESISPHPNIQVYPVLDYPNMLLEKAVPNIIKIMMKKTK